MKQNSGAELIFKSHLFPNASFYVFLDFTHQFPGTFFFKREGNKVAGTEGVKRSLIGLVNMANMSFQTASLFFVGLLMTCLPNFMLLSETTLRPNWG